jgi:hypothetical protein
MRTPRPLPEGAAERLAAMLQEAKNKAEYQRIPCVWLRAALSLPASQIATALGGQVGSVRQVHSNYLRQGETALRSKAVGGRPRQNLTREQARAGTTGSFSQTSRQRRHARGGSGAGRLGSCRRPAGPSFGGVSGAASPRMAPSHTTSQASQGQRGSPPSI